MTSHTNKIDIPFDQYSRQRIAKDIVDSLRKTGQQLKVLDVGGYKGNTNLFLSEDHVIVVDVEDIKEDNYIKGTGADLSFEDASFDVVCSFDVLEHIPEKDRIKFIEEAIRVSKYGVIVACPIRGSGSRAEHFELALNEVYKTLNQADHRWLKEHIDNKLPSIDTIVAAARSSNAKTGMIFSNKIESWALMQQAIFLASSLTEPSFDVGALNRYYNNHFNKLERGISQNDAYRTVCFISKNDLYMRKVEQVINKYANNYNPNEHGLLQAQALKAIALILRQQTGHLEQIHSQDVKKLVDYTEQIENSISWRLTAPLRSLHKTYKDTIKRRGGK